MLATGAVLVDLPGTGDSNVARGSIAERYLTKASAVWIVAPIIRAVNDRAAKASPLQAQSEPNERAVPSAWQVSAQSLLCAGWAT